MKKHAPHVAKAEQYARDVVSGKLPACKWVRLACQRHLNDLKRQKAQGFPYWFSPEKAERACKFFEGLPHTKGKWAKPDTADPSANLLKLEAWQCFIVCSAFGWLKQTTQLRRFRTVFTLIPRKNGKSDLAARTGLYMFAADAEFGAEVYSGATTQKQAWEVFRPAKQMAERSEGLRQHFGIEVSAQNLHITQTGSRFEPLIGDPGDGASPSCAVVDEYHEHQTDKLYSTMETGMGAREQPLMWVVSTAGDNIAGPCFQMQREAQQVLEGILTNEELFAIVYTVDDGDDWTSPDTLRKANPNFGVSVSEEFLLSKLAEARQSARKQGPFKTKHLNIWVSARNAWMNMEWWNACADITLRMEDFRGEECFVSLDLATKIDIASRIVLFTRLIEGRRHYYAFARHYLPEETLEERKSDHYRQWALEGWLTLTDGNEIDLTRIEEEIAGGLENGALSGGLVRDFQVREVIYDPWQATQMAQRLTAQGATTVEFRNTVPNFSDPMKEIEAAAKGGRLHHNGDPVLAWMVSNVTAKEDAKENIFPRKDVPENKIDGLVALIMAVARAMHDEDTCVYNSRGVLTI